MEFIEFLEKGVTEKLHRLVLSKAKKEAIYSKIKIRPIKLKEEILFQASLTKGKQEIHQNYRQKEMMEKISLWMKDFSYLELEADRVWGQILVSKRGKMTIKTKSIKNEKQHSLDHNRKKNYLIEEGRPLSYLVDLGVMTKEGKIIHSSYDKFRQINRYLEFIEDILPKLDKEREITIIDFGCGKSYLTFAMYDYLCLQKGYDAKIIGLDLKEEVIKNCNALAKKYGYEKLYFHVGDIASFEGVDKVDMVVSLHACDTATDYALSKAILWGAKVIFAVPCCQHEMNAQIENSLLAPIFSYGVLKERIAALLTDGLRGKILECAGYDTQILEFIDMEHTPKNLLIRGVRKGDKKEFSRELASLCEAFNINPSLKKLLYPGGENKA